MIAYYDLQTSPPTYDIVAFLVAAEHHRVRRGEPGVAIRILPGPAQGFRRDKYWPYTNDGRWQMLEGVALPMARMLPSATEVSLWRTRSKSEPNSIGYDSRLYGLRVLVECLKHGVRPLRAPAGGGPFDPKLITMTLREAEHWPERNSNMAEWTKAARELSAAGYRVVVVRDTRFASTEIDGIETSPQASLNLYSRAQLYRSAACNMFVNNGPAWFAMALDVPVMMFKPANRSASHFSEQYLKACGIDKQIPNAPDYQQIVWQEDNSRSIVMAFERFACTAAHA